MNNRQSAIRCQVSANSGFTLIEIIMIMIVAAIAIPALLFILGEGAKQGTYSELQVTATEVGQAMMEEIKTKLWDHNSPIPPGAYTTPLALEGTECRTNCTGLQCGANPIFNDVDDYNNYPETCPWNGASFTTSVLVCYVQPAALDTCVDPTTTDYKRIQVTVTNAMLGSVVLVTVVTNY